MGKGTETGLGQAEHQGHEGQSSYSKADIQHSPWIVQ